MKQKWQILKTTIDNINYYTFNCDSHSYFCTPFNTHVYPHNAEHRTGYKITNQQFAEFILKKFKDHPRKLELEQILFDIL